MIRKGASLLVLLGALASACAVPPVDLGRLRVAIWEPEALAGGVQGSLLDDAIYIDVTLLVDGREQRFALSGEGLVKDREIAPEGGEVVAELRTDGNLLPDAVGRTPKVRLEPGAGDVDAVALLAPPGAAHLLDEALPVARTESAICSAPDGRVWIVGGASGGRGATGSFLLDRSARTLSEGPALAPGRRDAGCAWDGQDGVWLVGGCDGEWGETSFEELLYAQDGAGGSFVEVAAVPGATCGARIVRLDSGRLFLFLGARMQVLSAAGEGLGESTLTPPRHRAHVFAAPGEEVYVAGGFDAPVGGNPVDGGMRLRITESGEFRVEENLPGFENARFAEGRGERYLLLDKVVYRLGPGGQREEVERVGTLPIASAPGAFALMGDEHAAVLAADGSRLYVARLGGASLREISLSPPRPGAQLVSEPGGAIYLFGGNVAGTLIVVAE